MLWCHSLTLGLKSKWRRVGECPFSIMRTFASRGFLAQNLENEDRNFFPPPSIPSPQEIAKMLKCPFEAEWWSGIWSGDNLDSLIFFLFFFLSHQLSSSSLYKRGAWQRNKCPSIVYVGSLRSECSADFLWDPSLCHWTLLVGTATGVCERGTKMVIKMQDKRNEISIPGTADTSPPPALALLEANSEQGAKNSPTSEVKRKKRNIF